MLKKRRKGLIASGILALSLAVAMFSPFSASAVTYYTYPNNAKMIGGVGSYGSHLRYYWINPNAQQYKSLIT